MTTLLIVFKLIKCNCSVIVYKVVGALGLSCITLLIYVPKSFKNNFVWNPLKLDDFMFSTKTLCQMLPNFV